MGSFHMALLFLFVLCFLGHHLMAVAQQNKTLLLPQEVLALRQIRAKLNVSWDFSVDPCSGKNGWIGPSNSIIASNVTCGNCSTTTGYCHVVSIVLKTQNLTGVLPEELSNLTFLQQIDLTRNNLHGGIPDAWASLPLIQISLGLNSLSGRIPRTIKRIKTLKSLALEDNLFRGPLPTALSRLTNLERLIISANDFDGEIPKELANLRKLTIFRIDGTKISGRIPDFIGTWTKLTGLDMQGTSLAGPFPTSFSNLKNLEQLRVSGIKSDGKFPPLQNCLKLKELILRNCSISGQIPIYIDQMTNLKSLDLSFNNFTGGIPSSFVDLKKIDNMYLMNNKLNGSLPDWIQRKKKNLDVSYNFFTGSPNGCNPGPINLVASYSSANHTDPCLGKPCQDAPGNFELFINCGGGNVNGDIVYEGDGSSQTGPSIFWRSPNQKWAYSSAGNFMDNDSAIYTVTTQQALNTSHADLNMSELYKSARLSPLSLKYYGLCLQDGIYNVSLHFAEIMFTNDRTYSSLGRRFFDVSIQGIQVLKDFNIANEANGTFKPIVKTFSAKVDDGTLEIHFQWAGKGTHSIPTKGVYGPLVSAISVIPTFEPNGGASKSKKRLSTGAIVGIVLASCLVFLLALLLLWFVSRTKRQENNDLGSLNLPTGGFTISQIKSATGNFDPAYKIGEGGFGSVYKGVLLDGSVIAVKQLSSKSRQGNREFVNEIGIISALQHPNLVKLFGCCTEGNQLLLIYEYMENNCLARALFGSEEMKLKLDWQIRCKICLDVARGLAYLHEESRLKIVHRDIKATNILLDKDLNAKISDFGLAKLHDDENSHVTTRVAGTKGYMAPEYAMRGHLTEKADVYSFGVVMLEIISGKPNFKYRPEEFMQLIDWGYELQTQNKLLDLVDSNLGTDYSKEAAERMLNLALLCTSTIPQQRPNMSAVVSMLESGAPIEVPTKSDQSETDQLRLGSSAYENLGTSSTGPWMDSSVITVSNMDTTSHSSPSTFTTERTE